MTKLVIAAIVVRHDIRVELNLHRVLDKPTGGFLMDLAELSDEVGALFDQLTLGLLE